MQGCILPLAARRIDLVALYTSLAQSGVSPDTHHPRRVASLRIIRSASQPLQKRARISNTSRYPGGSMLRSVNRLSHCSVCNS
jgi:hypothetical protein